MDPAGASLAGRLARTSICEDNCVSPPPCLRRSLCLPLTFITHTGVVSLFVVLHCIIAIVNKSRPIERLSLSLSLFLRNTTPGRGACADVLGVTLADLVCASLAGRLARTFICEDSCASLSLCLPCFAVCIHILKKKKL